MRKLRIQRLERAEPSGWWLAFTPGSDDFTISVALVRALPEWHRRWSAARRAWRVSDRGLRALAQYLPVPSVRLAGERSGRSKASSGELGPRWQYGPGRDCTHVPGLWPPLHRPVAAFVEAHRLPDAPAESMNKAERTVAQRGHSDFEGSQGRMVTANARVEQALLWAEGHDYGPGAAEAN